MIFDINIDSEDDDNSNDIQDSLIEFNPKPSIDTSNDSENVPLFMRYLHPDYRDENDLSETSQSNFQLNPPIAMLEKSCNSIYKTLKCSQKFSSSRYSPYSTSSPLSTQQIQKFSSFSIVKSSSSSSSVSSPNSFNNSIQSETNPKPFQSNSVSNATISKEPIDEDNSVDNHEVNQLLFDNNFIKELSNLYFLMNKPSRQRSYNTGIPLFQNSDKTRDINGLKSSENSHFNTKNHSHHAGHVESPSIRYCMYCGMFIPDLVSLIEHINSQHLNVQEKSIDSFIRTDLLSFLYQS